MPTTSGAYQRAYGGGVGDSYLGILSADGSRLEAATYFGGSGMERPPYGIELASNGDVVFTSGTTSPNLPVSAGAYRAALHAPVPAPGDGYVCRISGDLRTLRWCTYTGGGWPRGGLLLDQQDNVVVAGNVTGGGFTTTAGVVQAAARGVNDGFVLTLGADGRSALSSTRLGGTGTAGTEVALSLQRFPNGDLSVVGISQSSDFPVTTGAAQTASLGSSDTYIARLTPSAGTLVYSSLLSGSAAETTERRHALLPDGAVVVAGVTSSPTLPGAAGSLRGSSDGFVARLDPGGIRFGFVRYLGGSGTEHTLGPVVDAAGRLYLYGSTTSGDYPTTTDALQPAHRGGPTDAFLVILEPDGSLGYATYLGGSGEELIRGIVLGPSGEIYLVGRTTSDDFPVTAAAFQRKRAGDHDGFIVKLIPR
jgi:hypothetical protein